MEAMIHQFPVRRLSKDDRSGTFHNEKATPSPLTDCSDSRFDTVDVCTTQLWFPAQFESWNGFQDWSHDGFGLANETWQHQGQPYTPYTGATYGLLPSYTDSRTGSSESIDSPYLGGISYQPDTDVSRAEDSSPTQISSPPVRYQGVYQPPSETFPPDKVFEHYNDVQNRQLDSDWMGFGPKIGTNDLGQSLDNKPDQTQEKPLSTAFPQEYLLFNETAPETPISSQDVPTPVSKRKHTSPGPPPSKKSRLQAKPQEVQLAEYVGVFENAPGALTTVKKRKKLDGAVRKAAQDVRKAGACHQCRFRKRTCSTGTPCTSCLKNGRGLHDLKCQRESPFVGKSIHPYFEHSSTKRFLSFNVVLPAKSLQSCEACWVTIDGIGKVSLPFRLRAHTTHLQDFISSDRATIQKTKVTSKKDEDNTNKSDMILLLENNESIGTEIEQWAVEYASKFAHAAGPKFYPTTAAVMLGTAYLKKGLPESELIAALLRAASLAFVLRAGIKYTTTLSSPTTQYRTIQASIDTILYQRLKLAEKDLYKMLQRIVFRSLGYISREQIYPVALVFWQLLRMLSLSSSHLSNISERFNSIPIEHASYQQHALRLMLATHFALFRSSNPLLLDYNDKPNQDLLGGDEELIGLAMKMQKVVLDFREKGVTDMKGSIAYRKEQFDLFRKVYDGL